MTHLPTKVVDSERSYSPHMTDSSSEIPARTMVNALQSTREKVKKSRGTFSQSTVTCKVKRRLTLTFRNHKSRDRLTIIAENAVLVTNPCVKKRVIFRRSQYGIDLVNSPIRDKMSYFWEQNNTVVVCGCI